MQTVIAVDALGCDRGPKPEIEGVILAARHYGVKILLVGPEQQLRNELAHHPSARELPIDIVNATEVIGMHEKAAQAVRTKRDGTLQEVRTLVESGGDLSKASELLARMKYYARYLDEVEGREAEL